MGGLLGCISGGSHLPSARCVVWASDAATQHERGLHPRQHSRAHPRPARSSQAEGESAHTGLRAWGGVRVRLGRQRPTRPRISGAAWHDRHHFQLQVSVIKRKIVEVPSLLDKRE